MWKREEGREENRWELPEVGIGFTGTEVKKLWGSMSVKEVEPVSSGGVPNALHHWSISLFQEMVFQSRRMEGRKE